MLTCVITMLFTTFLPSATSFHAIVYDSVTTVSVIFDKISVDTKRSDQDQGTYRNLRSLGFACTSDSM